MPDRKPYFPQKFLVPSLNRKNNACNVHLNGNSIALLNNCYLIQS